MCIDRKNGDASSMNSIEAASPFLLFIIQMKKTNRRCIQMKKMVLLWVSILLLLFSAGCAGSGGTQSAGEQGTGAAASEEGPEPITLKVMRAGITVTKTEFEQTLQAATKAKYPHITLEWVDVPEDVDLAPLITQGNVPDIIFAGSSAISTTYKELDLPVDLTPYIEKHKVDLNKLKPAVLEAVKSYSEEGKIDFIPFSINLPVLFYNKEIFDKFGVPYPKDEQSTWDELIELGKQVTKTDNGVNYIGIDLGDAANVSSGLDLSILDPQTGKPSLTDPKWANVFETLKKSFEVPGYITENDRFQYANDDDIFFNEQNLAMVPYNLAHLLGPLEELRKQGVELDWDIAPFPNFAENKGTGKGINVHSVFVTKASKHPEEAFLVLANLLNEDVQEILSRNGRVPTINNEAIEKVFGTNIPVLEGKKVENIFKAEPRVVIKPHRFESKVRKHVNEAVKSVAVGGQDVNTALRTALDNVEKELITLNNTK